MVASSLSISREDHVWWYIETLSKQLLESAGCILILFPCWGGGPNYSLLQWRHISQSTTVRSYDTWVAFLHSSENSYFLFYEIGQSWTALTQTSGSDIIYCAVPKSLFGDPINFKWIYNWNSNWCLLLALFFANSFDYNTALHWP